MLTRQKTSWDVPYSDLTPEPVYRSRRDFIATAVTAGVGLAAGAGLSQPRLLAQANLAPLAATRNQKYVSPGKVNSFQDITTYNNFYEFGVEKSDPSQHAGALKVKPWTVKVDGLVGKPGNYAVEDLVNFKALEERIYRLRCVEGWSMVIPWIGVPLADILKKVEPAPAARFVEFTTLLRPSEMFAQRSSVLDWPYLEALRLDEAMHPLTLMVVGLYGKVLPNQNGAPMRLMVPWKYGFKSGKSIVRIRFTDRQPQTTWMRAIPEEYGFYANVNPGVSHPRWSQAREVRLPGFLKNTPTQMFNGYTEVASLYTGMDLRKNF